MALADVPWPLTRHPGTRDEAQLRQTLQTFHVVRGRRGEIVARRRGLRIIFRQVEPHRAAVLFRRGRLDEAPVPLGDIAAARADRTVAEALRVSPLAAIDSLVATRLPSHVREALSATADRRNYALLVPENIGAATGSPPARFFRDARRGIPSLPRVQVRIADPHNATLRYGAALLAASWRDLGLDVRIVQRRANAFFVRRAAPGSIPIAHAVDARFVSPRVIGWKENGRGVVDYTRVRLRR